MTAARGSDPSRPIDSSARRSASAVGKRCSGRRAAAFSSTSANARESRTAPAAAQRSSIPAPLATLAIVAPSANTSVRGEAGAPSHSSGAM